MLRRNFSENYVYTVHREGNGKIRLIITAESGKESEIQIDVIEFDQILDGNCNIKRIMRDGWHYFPFQVSTLEEFYQLCANPQ